jgi:hypothetical protein
MNMATHGVDEHHIRETAYHLWEKDGRPIGQDHRHWEMAKRLAEATVISKAAPKAAVASPKKKTAAKPRARIQ